MKRTEVEHVVKSAGLIAKDKKVLVIGSNAIYGSIKLNDCGFYKSNEVDIVFFSDNEKKSLEVDGAIGEKSNFHMTFNYYAHGVSVDTAILPRGWEKRLCILYSENMGHIKGYCISAEDLAASKLVAGREKDFAFVEGMLENEITNIEKIEKIINKLPRKKDIALNNLNVCRQRVNSENKMVDPVGLEPTTRRL
jgi:uncharacterized nucleotidyltransferase DUF6036